MSQAARKLMQAAGIGIAVMFFLFVSAAWLPWSVHLSALQMIAAGLVLTVAELAPIHAGKSRFRFSIAAQVPLLLHVGVFPVILGQAVILLGQHAWSMWRLRQIVLYTPRIISALGPPLAAGALVQLWMHPATSVHINPLLPLGSAIVVYWLVVLGCRAVPGQRHVVHPWQSPPGWLGLLIILDLLMTFAAWMQDAVNRNLNWWMAALEIAIIVAAIAFYTDASIRRARLVQLSSLMVRLRNDATMRELVDHLLVELPLILAIDAAALWMVGNDLLLRPVFVRSYAGPSNRIAAELESRSPAAFGFGLVGFAASCKSVMRLHGPNERVLYDRESAPELQASAAAVPLSVGDQVIGVLGAYHASPAAYGGREDALLAVLGEQISSMLGNLWRYEQTRAQSETDELTGLFNYRYFDEAVEAAVAASAAAGEPITLMIVDIDHFKRVNDRYGHHAGNQVLSQLAHTMREAVRDTDTVARYGGEEFTVLLPGITATEAATIAERLRKRVEEMAFAVEPDLIPIEELAEMSVQAEQERGGEAAVIELGAADHKPETRSAGRSARRLAESRSKPGRQNGSGAVERDGGAPAWRTNLHITLSIGLATYPDNADSALSLLRHADRAMYVGSKQRGRNRVSSYR